MLVFMEAKEAALSDDGTQAIVWNCWWIELIDYWFNGWYPIFSQTTKARGWRRITYL